MFLPFSPSFLSFCPFVRFWGEGGQDRYQSPRESRPRRPGGDTFGTCQRSQGTWQPTHTTRCNELEKMDGLVVIRCAKKSCTKTKSMSHVQNVQISGVRGCRLFFHGLKDSRCNKCLPRNRWLSWCSEVLQRSTDVDPKLSVFFLSWDLRGRCFEHVARSPSFATHIVSEFVSMWVENGRL